MSEPFLSRWSRRKRESTSPPEGANESAGPAASSILPQGEGGEDRRSEPGRVDSPPKAERAESPPHPDPLPASGEREFDPAGLPPIESIDAGTDVSAFLRPGVPADLAQAALRRAWVTDPAIRDFVGLAENAWDFNAPGGVPGFEPLRAIDVQRLAAQVAGALSAVTADSAEEAKEIAATDQAAAQEVQAPEPEPGTPQDDAAVQKHTPPAGA
ncbi:MAG: DUF3306 domain-containing protein [Bradyrhizobiaceae bacterium]|nr:DUF3306 domain-containing protein [Hyphomicrobiales bacterium]MBV9428939.1 DUF3306 domain-containing protein [Bradyrhizobiaceae bacterium]